MGGKKEKKEQFLGPRAQDGISTVPAGPLTRASEADKSFLLSRGSLIPITEAQGRQIVGWMDDAMCAISNIEPCLQLSQDNPWRVLTSRQLQDAFLQIQSAREGGLQAYPAGAAEVMRRQSVVTEKLLQIVKAVQDETETDSIRRWVMDIQEGTILGLSSQLKSTAQALTGEYLSEAIVQVLPEKTKQAINAINEATLRRVFTDLLRFLVEPKIDYFRYQTRCSRQYIPNGATALSQTIISIYENYNPDFAIDLLWKWLHYLQNEKVDEPEIFKYEKEQIKSVIASIEHTTAHLLKDSFSPAYEKYSPGGIFDTISCADLDTGRASFQRMVSYLRPLSEIPEDMKLRIYHAGLSGATALANDIGEKELDNVGKNDLSKKYQDVVIGLLEVSLSLTAIMSRDRILEFVDTIIAIEGNLALPDTPAEKIRKNAINKIILHIGEEANSKFSEILYSSDPESTF